MRERTKHRRHQGWASRAESVETRAIPLTAEQDARSQRGTTCAGMRAATPFRKARSINHDARRQAQGLVSAPWCVPCPWFPDCSLLLSFCCVREFQRDPAVQSLASASASAIRYLLAQPPCLLAARVLHSFLDCCVVYEYVAASRGVRVLLRGRSA